MSDEELIMSAIAEALADMSVVAGWTHDETLNAVRRALAGAGERLGLKRQDVAERLGASRRILSEWDDKPATARRRQLDVILGVHRDERVVAAPDEAQALKRAAHEALRFGLITPSRTLGPATVKALSRSRGGLLAAADKIGSKNTKAQLSLGSRDANTQQTESVGAPQPGHTDANGTRLDRQENRLMTDRGPGDPGT